jgi:salicylate hydroxylase
MNEDSSTTSWTSEGSLEDVLKSYDVFPEWCKELFRRAPGIGLWQLRDIDPLPTWVKGQVMLIGDAAHAMLPLQGQGASQTFEDVVRLFSRKYGNLSDPACITQEALKAVLADVQGRPSKEEIRKRLQVRYTLHATRAYDVDVPFACREPSEAVTTGLLLYKATLEQLLPKRRIPMPKANLS